MAKKQTGYNGQTVERSPLIKNEVIDHNDLMRQFYTGTHLTRRLAGDITAGQNSPIALYSIDKNKKMDKNKDGSESLRYFVNLFDLAPTPNKQSGSQLMYKTIERNSYIPLKSSIRRNPFDLLASYDRALKANEFLVYDLETLSGADEKGRIHNDFITEVSLRHYTDMPIGGKYDPKKIATGKYTINALLGLSETDAKSVSNLLDRFLNGNIKYTDLTSREQVYIKELIKFSGATSGESNGFKVINNKLSNEEAEKLLRGSHALLVSRTKEGIDFLRSNYDPTAYARIQSHLSSAAEYVSGTETAMFMSANGMNFDSPFLHKIFGIDIEPSMQFDVTELAQLYNNFNGSASRGGATVSSLYEQLSFPALQGAHIADVDTLMTALVGTHGHTKEMIDHVREQVNQNAQQMMVGGIYNIDASLHNPLSFVTNGNVGIGSTGDFYSLVDGYKSRTFGYDFYLNSNAPYVLTGMREVEFDALPKNIQKNLIEYKGDNQTRTKKIHAITFEPLYYANEKVDSYNRLPSSTAESTTTFFFTDDEFSMFTGGLGKQIGTAPITVNDRGQNVVDWVRDSDFVFNDIVRPNVDLSTTEGKQALKEYNKSVKTKLMDARSRIKNITQERAVRKYEESEFKMLNSYRYVMNGTFDMSLAEVYSKNDIDGINRISGQIAKLLDGREALLKDGIDDIYNYHTTYEALGNLHSLSPYLQSVMPVFNGIIEEIDARGLTEDTKEATFNRMFHDVMSAINITHYGSGGHINFTAADYALGQRILPEHKNQLSTVLSTDISPAYKKTRSFTINFDDTFGSYKIGDRLLAVSDIDTTGMSEQSVNYIKKNLLNTFVHDVMKSTEHGSAASDAIRSYKNKIIDKHGNIVGLTDDTISADYISKNIFDALKSGGVRTSIVPFRNAPAIPSFTKNNVIKMFGNKIHNADELQASVREMAHSLPTVQKLTDGDSFMNAISDALIDPSMRSMSAYEDYLINVAHIDKKHASTRARLYYNLLDDYKKSVKDIVSAYIHNGIDFTIENGSVYAKDATTDFVKLNLPELRVSNNGIGYIKYGKKSVGLDYKFTLDGLLSDRNAITTTFSDAISPWKSSKRSVLRNGSSLRSLLSDIGYKYSNVGDASDTAALNRSHVFTSGGTLDITEIATRMFSDTNGTRSLDSSGALEYLKKNNPELYNRLSKLYKDAKYSSVPSSMTNVGMEFFEVFNQNMPAILESVSIWSRSKGENASDPMDKTVFADTLMQLNLAETSDKMYSSGKLQIGRAAYSYEEGFQNKHRGTGIQTSKGQTLRADKLKEAGFTQIHNILETNSSVGLSVQKDLYGIEGLDTTTGFISKVLHMDQDEYEKAISDFISKNPGLKQDIEKVYGEGSYETIMKSLVNANIRNDGSIIFDEASRVMSMDRVNNVYENVVEKSIYVMDKNDSKRILKKTEDYIPEFTIDPETRAVRVKFSNGFFAERGSSLQMMNYETGIIEHKMLKRDFIGNISFINDQKIELTAKETEQLIGKISGIENILNGNFSDKQKFEAVANELYKQYGIRTQLTMKNIARHNKFGFGEEKTLGNTLSLALGATQQSRDILKKYGFSNRYSKSILDTIVTDEALEFFASDLGISSDDLSTLRKTIASPTLYARKVLGIGSDVSAISNTKHIKHGSAAQDVSSMLEAIRRESPNVYTSLIKDVFGSNASIMGDYTLIDDIDEIDTNLIVSSFNKLRGFNKNISYERFVAMDDWEAKKYAGEIDSIKADIIRQYRNGEISLRDANRKIQDIESRADDNLGTLFGQREYNILARNYMTTDSMSDILYGESDESVSRIRKRLVSRGIIQGSGNEYILAGDYALGNRSFLEKTLENLSTVMKSGAENELKLQDYINGDYVPSGYYELINKYSGNREFANYTLDKLDAYDTFERNKSIVRFNDNPRTRNLSNERVIRASELEVANRDTAKYITNAGNKTNPYTNDIVIDLGEDFGDDRYLKTLGTIPSYKDDILIKPTYQEHYGRLRELSNIYEEAKNGILSDETKTLYNLRDNPIKTLHGRILSLRSQIIKEQTEYAAGKKSVASEMISMRSKISGMFESQSISPVSSENLLGFDITTNLEFDGMKLSEHAQNKRLIDYGVISRSSAERMGLYNENFMKKHIDSFRKQNASAYNKIINSLGSDAADADIMDNILKNYGIGGFINRYPSIQRKSIMSAQLYVSDNIGDDTMLLPQYLQDKMKNDNDSDKVSFSIFDYDAIDQEEVSTDIFAQSGRNYRDVLVGNQEPQAKRFDAEEILKSVAIDGKLYKNIEDIDEYVKLNNDVKFGAYGSIFGDIYKHDKDKVAFDQAVRERMIQDNLGDDFAAAMEQKYISQRRIDQYDLAASANSSKSKVGIANNTVERLVNVGTGYTSAMLENQNLSDIDRIRYQAAREIALDTRGGLIEDIINAKNTADLDAVNRVSKLTQDARSVLYDNDISIRAAAAESIRDTIVDVTGSKIKARIESDMMSESAMRGSSIIQFLTSKGYNLADDASNGYESEIKELAGLLSDMYAETDTSVNKKFKDFMNIGYAGVSDGAAMTSPLIDYDSTYSDILYDRLSENSNTAERVAFSSDTADRIMGSNISGSSKTSDYFKRGANFVTNILDNVSGKNLAIGALGLAAGLMAVGYIGGNPSSAPQDDANQMAYTEDNYNYDTGTVMYPPMSQAPKNGYVINLKGSTNGSYSAARGSIVQAVQQNYTPNMNVNVRQNFSYSAHEDNDRYVENLLRDLMI